MKHLGYKQYPLKAPLWTLHDTFSISPHINFIPSLHIKCINLSKGITMLFSIYGFVFFSMLNTKFSTAYVSVRGIQFLSWLQCLKGCLSGEILYSIYLLVKHEQNQCKSLIHHVMNRNYLLHYCHDIISWKIWAIFTQYISSC